MRRALPLLAAALAGFALGWFLRPDPEGPERVSVPPPAPGPRAKREPQALPRLPPGDVAAEASEVALLTKHPCAVEGTVSDVGKGPLAEVTVLLLREGAASEGTLSATTGADGRFRFERVPEGSYRAALLGGSLGRSPRRMGKLVVPAGGATIARDFVVGWPGLSGIVTDAETGAPVPGVSVSVQSGGPYWKDTTDGEGRYRIRDLGPGEYRLCVSKDGYGIEFPRGVRVSEGGGALDLSLTPASTLVVEITDDRGRPVSGNIMFSFSSASGPEDWIGTGIRADETGRAVYRQIVPGDYALELQVPGVGGAKVAARLEAGENRIEVRLEKD